MSPEVLLFTCLHSLSRKSRKVTGMVKTLGACETSLACSLPLDAFRIEGTYSRTRKSMVPSSVLIVCSYLSGDQLLCRNNMQV